MTEPNITPLARRLAEENGIDWRSLEGSGPDGTIVERDILAFLAKVMAGEVELPPQPEDMAPPEELPDISQVQEALAREGVDLEELVPGITSETVPSEAAAPEEEVLFEMSFEEELIAEEETPVVEEPPAEPEKTEPPEGEYFAAEPPATEEATITEEGVDFFEPIAEEEAAPVESEPAPWETSLEQSQDADQALEELEEEFSWESEQAAAGAESFTEETPFAEPVDESAGWSVVEEPEAKEEETELEPEPDTAVETEPAVEEAAPAEETGESMAAAASSAEEDLGETEEVAETTAADAGVAAAVAAPAFRRAVDLGALEKARQDLSEAWMKNVPTSLLLFRAVDRAMAELEVPMRPVIGKLEGDTVKGIMVYPADNLRALFNHYLEAEEPAEGLAVIDLAETPYAEVVIPDSPLVTLGYTGMPEGYGLLSISGELPTDRARFLERVAFYLERPILLA